MYNFDRIIEQSTTPESLRRAAEAFASGGEEYQAIPLGVTEVDDDDSDEVSSVLESDVLYVHGLSACYFSSKTELVIESISALENMDHDELAMISMGLLRYIDPQTQLSLEAQATEACLDRMVEQDRHFVGGVLYVSAAAEEEDEGVIVPIFGFASEFEQTPVIFSPTDLSSRRHWHERDQLARTSIVAAAMIAPLVAQTITVNTSMN